MRKFLRSLFAVLCALMFVAQAWAQGYPNRPVKMVMPYPAGGSTDVIGRVIAEHLGKALGKAIVVDNRGGASARIGTELAAKSSADGYTLVMLTSTNTINQALRPNLPYDVNTAFQPVAMVCTIAQVLVVHPSVPSRNLREFIDYAKKSQGKLSYSSSGEGTSGHLAMEALRARAGFEMLHVPYKGSAPAMNDLLSGQVQAGFVNAVTALPQIKAGKLRAIAVTSSSRAALLPDIPSIAESGFPGYEVIAWFGLAAPAGLPAEVGNRLVVETARVLKRDDVQQRLFDLGVERSAIATPRQMADFLKQDVGHWAQLMKIAGVEPE